jgi:hypothetical protein
MRYIYPSFKAIFTVFIFLVAASIARDSFQNIVIAGMGYIYSIANIGILSIRHQNAENMIITMRLFASLAQSIPNFEEDIDQERLWGNLDKADRNLAQGNVINLIDMISNVLVVIGSTYLVIVSAV